MVVYRVNKLASYLRGANDNIQKIMNEYGEHRRYCKCGHSVVISPKYQRAMCSWCNHWVYEDEEKQKEYDKEIGKREALLKFKKEMRKRL